MSLAPHSFACVGSGSGESLRLAAKKLVFESRVAVLDRNSMDEAKKNPVADPVGIPFGWVGRLTLFVTRIV